MSTKIFANGGKIAVRTPTGVNLHAVGLQVERQAHSWPIAWLLKLTWMCRKWLSSL